MRLVSHPAVFDRLYNPAATDIPFTATVPNFVPNGSTSWGRVAGVGMLGDSPEDDPGEAPGFGSNLTTGVISGYTTGVNAALQSGSKTVGAVAGVIAMAAPFAGPAAPVLLAIAGLIGPVASMFKGCGDTCKQATEIANQAGAALERVAAEYWNAPVRYKSAQLAALYAIEQVAGYINKACGNPALGPAGQRCISERTVRGGSAPWCPTGTGCDLWTTYYDPIANDTGVVPDPLTPEQLASQTGNGSSTQGTGGTGIQTAFPVPLMLLAGGGLLLLLTMGKD